MDQLEKLVTLAQAAEALGVTTKTLRTYIAEGRLPAVRIGNQLIRVRASDVASLARPIPTVGNIA
jgi:excisionase family DNA binding protein